MIEVSENIYDPDPEISSLNEEASPRLKERVPQKSEGTANIARKKVR